MTKLGYFTDTFKMIGLLSSLPAVVCIMMHCLTFLTYGMWITFYEAYME